MLQRRKESNIYLATVIRHRWSGQITMKIDKLELMKATVLAESSNLSIFIVISLLQWSTDSSQVDVALFPSC